MAFGLEYTDSSYSNESYLFDIEEHFPVMQAKEIPKASSSKISSLDPIPLLPNIEVHILPSKYDVPIKAIVFIDIGAQNTLMNLLFSRPQHGNLVFIFSKQ